MHLPRLVPPTSGDPADHRELRRQVRDFLDAQRAAGSFAPAVDCWLTAWDENFTRALAERGWIGMTVPTRYGGQGRSFIERFVVTEELLVAGAPVAAHWIADRQIVPSLLKYGTEDQKQFFLPGIARGEIFFGIGMSEPESGSDLASVRTTAVRTDGGWTINGSKIWTSGAHCAHAFIVLARTGPIDPTDRHAGLSQFIVDLHSPGVEVRPIESMTGTHHFNEVFLTDVFVPDSMVFGRIGMGWKQVTSELSFERSGPERFLSTFPILGQLCDRVGDDGKAELGYLVSRIAGLHQMSAAISGALERGDAADIAAAVTKVLGTTMEGDIAEAAHLTLGDGAPSEPEWVDLVTAGVDQRPGFTLRGGTNEVLRGVIARGLGIR
ncbi:acyl-CoA dehydrogenase family protein [Rhodococcus rhodochrous]|uniref:Acyl-CoA dehydrogenase family protein n=1 Tax=Rhodococcus rhodochrous TaxID=1829 RepID=A0AAW4XNX9_RHORH|nr:acyl-CoA dehydrogenase family protein [Rhodococcus rhodochrous]MCD2114596.1 acyl-CoA dehydrogenase family protein [Rhodococcus rhodochrous]